MDTQLATPQVISRNGVSLKFSSNKRQIIFVRRNHGICCVLPLIIFLTNDSLLIIYVIHIFNYKSVSLFYRSTDLHSGSNLPKNYFLNICQSRSICIINIHNIKYYRQKNKTAPHFLLRILKAKKLLLNSNSKNEVKPLSTTTAVERSISLEPREKKRTWRHNIFSA